ncbi:MAG: protein YgfX [Noviherbaspirillum sp.]
MEAGTCPPSTSIAVSAVIHPSRRLRLAVAFLCAIVAGGGLPGLAANPVPERFVLAGIGLLCAFFGIFQFIRTRKTFHIDISGIGQIRLQDDYKGAVSEVPGNPGSAGENGALVRLCGDSTLWPGLLLLRLQAESGPPWVLPILRDSVSATEYRGLAVACRWIAAHNIRAE